MNDSLPRKLDVDTPCLVLDEAVFERNMRTVHDAAAAAGKRVRPHAKSHKCSTIARKQAEAGAIGHCVAKVSEAEALLRAGLKDVLITGPLATRAKMERFADLIARGSDVLVVVDNMDCARGLDETLRARNLRAGVLLDLDVGLARTGIPPDEAVQFARMLQACAALTIRGVQAYAGQVQHIPCYEDRKKESLTCMRNVARFFSALQKECTDCRIFSGAGTGTYDIDLAIPELTELQAGSYVLMDVEYMDVGLSSDACLGDQLRPALTLLTSVVSVNQREFVTVDAGLKTLYRHGGTPRALAPKGDGALTYDWFGDEYGKLIASEGQSLPGIGTVIELAVSHCDPTVNLFDQYYVCRNEEIVDTWPIDLRGKSQ